MQEYIHHDAETMSLISISSIIIYIYTSFSSSVPIYLTLLVRACCLFLFSLSTSCQKDDGGEDIKLLKIERPTTASLRKKTRVRLSSGKCRRRDNQSGEKFSGIFRNFSYWSSGPGVKPLRTRSTRVATIHMGYLLTRQASCFRT